MPRIRLFFFYCGACATNTHSERKAELSNDTSNTLNDDSDSPVTAILWDFGGVFTSSPFEAFNTLEERLGAPKDFIRQTNAINPESNAWAKFESNSVSLDEFDVLFAQESEARGHRILARTLSQCCRGPCARVWSRRLKLCKQHYRVACITNNVKAGEGPGMARQGQSRCGCSSYEII